MFLCWCINVRPLYQLVCLPHNAYQCIICSLISPSVFFQKSCFQGFFKASWWCYQMLAPMYWCRPPVATDLPASQCLLVLHPCTDSSLSFAWKIIFSGLFRSILVVLLYASANVSMPVLHSPWSASLTMPASQCLPVPHLSTDSSLSFASNIMFLQLFRSL